MKKSIETKSGTWLARNVRQDFRIGNAARCFELVKAWVEKKVRRPPGLRLEAVEYGVDL